MPKAQSESRVHPTEAQVSTLPHYLDHSATLGRTENQVLHVTHDFELSSKAKHFHYCQGVTITVNQKKMVLYYLEQKIAT